MTVNPNYPPFPQWQRERGRFVAAQRAEMAYALDAFRSMRRLVKQINIVCREHLIPAIVDAAMAFNKLGQALGLKGHE